MDYGHMPAFANNDVEENLEDSGRKMEDLTHEEYLNAYLEWNGIIGYSSHIWAILQALQPNTLREAVRCAHVDYELDEETIDQLVHDALNEEFYP